MLVIVELRDITEEFSNDGSALLYQEFLFSDPLEAGRVNVTKYDAARLNQLREFQGKKVLTGLRIRKTSNGSDYYSFTRSPVLANPTKPA